MEWLILRLHRLNVEKFGPITSDLSNWIRAINEFRKNDRVLRQKIREMKAEGVRFQAEMERIKAETLQVNSKFKELDEGFRRD